MKINSVMFDDDHTPLSCSVTITIEEAAMMIDLLKKEIPTVPPAAFVYLHLEGLFNGLYEGGIEGYRQKAREIV